MIFSKSGSSTVEAALVYPIFILVIFGIISISLKYWQNEKTNSSTHIEEMNAIIVDDSVSAEDILRAKWVTN